eukprot:5517296-Pyramimonas_sp.AAC.1
MHDDIDKDVVIELEHQLQEQHDDDNRNQHIANAEEARARNETARYLHALAPEQHDSIRPDLQ